MFNPMDLTGKNILVTGASSGIGRSIAIYISKLGANVIITARNEERLKEVLSEMEPGDHSYYLFDLSNLDDIENLINKISSSGIKLDGLVHSAGISSTVPLQYLKLEDLNKIMTVNFYSFVELVKHFTKKKFAGSIVAISSISARAGARGLTAYASSKGALDSAIKSMALDLAPKGIRVNAVAPAMIKTQIYDGLQQIVNNNTFEAELKKRQVMGIGEPEDVAYATAFLLSDESRFITGTSMIVDGGYLAH